MLTHGHGDVGPSLILTLRGREAGLERVGPVFPIAIL